MVAMSKQNVPTLRLEGFNGEWSQSVLGSFARKVNEKNVDLSVAETFTNSAEKGVISQTEYFKHQVSNDMNLGGYYVVQPNDFIYNPRISTGAPVGPINRNKLERVGVVSPLYTVFRLSLIDHSFLDWFFKSPYWHGFMRENGDSGARGDRLSIGQDLFFQMPVATPPTLEEQQAIGAIFTNLDVAINQHTLKHTSLQQAKTALLQRMFPQEGQTVPELRLEGFDGEWEEKRLVDEVSFFSGLTYTPSDVVEHYGTLVLRSSNVQDGVIATKDCVYVRTDAVNVQNVRKNDIIMVVRNGSRSLIGKHAVVQTPMPATVIGAFMTGIRTNQPWFYNALFSTDLFKYEVDKSMGATINQITGGMFAGMSFYIPPTLEEQQAIGAVFTNLDQLIAAEAQYIKSLKQAKTALLQRMFI